METRQKNDWFEYAVNSYKLAAKVIPVELIADDKSCSFITLSTMFLYNTKYCYV